MVVMGADALVRARASASVGAAVVGAISSGWHRRAAVVAVGLGNSEFRIKR